MTEKEVHESPVSLGRPTVSSMMGKWSYDKRAKVPDNYVIKDNAAVFPTGKFYVMQAKVENAHLSGLIELQDTLGRYGQFSPDKAVTEDMAITQFIMDESGANDAHILMLFNNPETVHFEIVEETYVILNGYPSVIKAEVVKSGAELKSQLLEDGRLRETHAEILRVKMQLVKEQEEKDKAELREKRENWFHQWEWLEAKRLRGEFDEFTVNQEPVL
jgi:hypothetical protein